MPNDKAFYPNEAASFSRAGVTVREHMAMEFVKALIRNGDRIQDDVPAIAKKAVYLTDQVLTELQK